MLAWMQAISPFLSVDNAARAGTGDNPEPAAASGAATAADVLFPHRLWTPETFEQWRKEMAQSFEIPSLAQIDEEHGSRRNAINFPMEEVEEALAIRIIRDACRDGPSGPRRGCAVPFVVEETLKLAMGSTGQDVYTLRPLHDNMALLDQLFGPREQGPLQDTRGAQWCLCVVVNHRDAAPLPSWSDEEGVWYGRMRPYFKGAMCRVVPVLVHETVTKFCVNDNSDGDAAGPPVVWGEKDVVRVRREQVTGKYRLTQARAVHMSAAPLAFRLFADGSQRDGRTIPMVRLGFTPLPVGDSPAGSYLMSEKVGAPSRSSIPYAAEPMVPGAVYQMTTRVHDGKDTSVPCRLVYLLPVRPAAADFAISKALTSAAIGLLASPLAWASTCVHMGPYVIDVDMLHFARKYRGPSPPSLPSLPLPPVPAVSA